MSAIGAVEDAYGAAVDARNELDNAVDCAEGEGNRRVAQELRQINHEMDNLVNRISQQREALR